MGDRERDLDRFYALLARLEKHCAERRRLAECDGRMGWPQRGVYFFFETGEFREDGTTPRVVRVGTHALGRSQTTLWRRLSQHKGHPGGTMPGGGNHRGSIFRLHVGTALLASGSWASEIRSSWGQGASAPLSTRLAEYPLEKAVSLHIGSMPFLWLGVDNSLDLVSERGVIEAGSIALLSNSRGPVSDSAAPGWLGGYADRQAIRDSGLWNVNHVREQYDPAFLDALERHVDLTPMSP